ncbi:hypothetical protein Bbelb_340110 [Branchiostoma belcheri]|nr:hypothetical protein Bbelb_340110 [Branchiostoma belcheri]
MPRTCRVQRLNLPDIRLTSDSSPAAAMKATTFVLQKLYCVCDVVLIERGTDKPVTYDTQRPTRVSEHAQHYYGFTTPRSADKDPFRSRNLPAGIASSLSIAATDPLIEIKAARDVLAFHNDKLSRSPVDFNHRGAKLGKESSGLTR